MNLTRLKPSHLRLVRAIADTGKLQDAAAGLAMSQPAASRLLSEIEATVGAPLFERQARGMRPTALGESFVQHAGLILAEYDALETDIAMLRSGLSGQVRIGTVTGSALGLVLPAIRDLRRTAPGIEATIHVAPSADLMRGLEARLFDFIVARPPAGHDLAALEVTPARSEKVALLVHRTHPLAGRGTCTLSELAACEWVMQDRGTPIRQAVEAAFFHAGCALPARVTNSSSLLVALALLAEEQAISPQAQEVADLLTGIGTGAALAVIGTERPITVAPYFVIRERQRSTTRAVAEALNGVLARL
jgi:DNA-binding transcriptional LysR family regulator